MNADLKDTICEEITKFQELQMGIVPRKATVMIEEDMIVVHLKEMLSPAENHLALSQKGQYLLMEFNVLLFEGPRQYLEDVIVETMGRKVVDVQTAISPLTGSIVALFMLGEPAEIEVSCE